MGQVYMTTYTGDQQVRSFQNGSKISVEIRRVLYALSLLNSDYVNPYSQRVRVVRPSYT